MSIPMVLLIHEDADFRRLYRIALERIGFGVDDTWDADDALMLARKTPYALILTDLYVEAVTTTPIVERLREVCAATPILVVTGWVSDRDRELATLWGATEYVARPATPGAVVGAAVRLAGAPAVAVGAAMRYTTERPSSTRWWGAAS